MQSFAQASMLLRRLSPSLLVQYLTNVGSTATIRTSVVTFVAVCLRHELTPGHAAWFCVVVYFLSASLSMRQLFLLSRAKSKVAYCAKTWLFWNKNVLFLIRILNTARSCCSRPNHFPFTFASKWAMDLGWINASFLGQTWYSSTPRYYKSGGARLSWSSIMRLNRPLFFWEKVWH